MAVQTPSPKTEAPLPSAPAPVWLFESELPVPRHRLLRGALAVLAAVVALGAIPQSDSRCARAPAHMAPSGSNCPIHRLHYSRAGIGSALWRYRRSYAVGEDASKLHDDMRAWMDEHEYDSIAPMRGSMSQLGIADPAAFERANYLRVLGSIP